MSEPIKLKPICAECSHWEPGDFWGTSDRKRGTIVESKGWCTAKPNKRKRWNYHPSCNLFDKRKRTAFIYQGGGGNSIQEDLTNIAALMRELAEDNKQ